MATQQKVGQVYVVIGASRGIGLEFVSQLATRQDTPTVYATVRTLSPTSDLQNFAKTHPNVKILQADLTDVESLVRAAHTVEKEVGRVDVLIVNGGQWRVGKLLDNVDKDILELVEVNALGPIRAIRAFLPLVRKGSVKKIAVLSSAAASITLNVPEVLGPVATLQVPYGASKHFQNYLVHQVAYDLKPDGISVAIIHPGLVTTEMSIQALSNYPPELIANLAKNNSAAAAISPVESVKTQLNVIDNLTLENSGKFVDNLNNPLPW